MMSVIRMSGESESTFAEASSPLLEHPTTSMSGSAESVLRRSSQKSGSASAMNTLCFTPGMVFIISSLKVFVFGFLFVINKLEISNI